MARSKKANAVTTSASSRPSSPKPRVKPQEPVQANDLRTTRKAHARETAEDYSEAIADLIVEQGEARVTDLARKLGVTHVTVNRTIARLQQEGYVTSLPYRSIFLTEKGKLTAAESKHRHQTVVAFLRLIGVSNPTAHSDAEGIEHHISPETLKAIEQVLAKRALP